jgi:hypothetical protein
MSEKLNEEQLERKREMQKFRAIEAPTSTAETVIRSMKANKSKDRGSRADA